jgi:phage terminase large subunit GpA-like protein
MATLADLQTERETLRAAQAKADFEAAHATTCAQSDLLGAALSIRSALLAMIDSAADRFLDAIRGERDETRVHYLMSDVAHDMLARVGESAAAASGALPIVGEQLRRGVKPRDLLTVSQWSDRHRELKSGTNAPGRWRTALTPYLAEIMDSLSEHSPVRQVTFIKSSGVGGTEAMYNWLGYIMQHLQNKDLLVVVPTLELRDRSFNPRLAKMLDESQVLAELVSKASRNKSNRGDLLEYGARARIIKAGANSPDSLRSDHLPYVIADEVDAFPWDVGGEGDPMTLIENRQRTYSRAKTYLVSTPTTAGASRIDLQYQRSDRRRYHVPCPHCHERQHLEFGGKDKPWGLKWRVAPQLEGEDASAVPQVSSAWYVCRHCGAEIDEGHKADMLARGQWVAERPAIKHHRGYHLNALYAPVGLGLNWRAVAQKWLASQSDSSELKSFVNTYLGEVWKEQGDNIEDLSLLSRCEDYPEDLRSTRIALVTSFTDVQKDRLETTIVGWGPGEEAWVLDHEIHPGDTARPECWEDLDGYLREAGVHIAGVDAGYNTSMVQAFVAPRRWCVATKGVAGLGRPLIEDPKKRAQRLRTRRKKGQPLEPLGVDQGKALVYARCKLLAPGPGYIHFPRSAAFDDEWFAQLAAEKLVTKIKGTRPFQEWVQSRPRNEALDCMVGNLAMMRLSGRALVVVPAGGAAPVPARPAPRRIGRIGGFR